MIHGKQPQCSSSSFLKYRIFLGYGFSFLVTQDVVLIYTKKKIVYSMIMPSLFFPCSFIYTHISWFGCGCVDIVLLCLLLLYTKSRHSQLVWSNGMLLCMFQLLFLHFFIASFSPISPPSFLSFPLPTRPTHLIKNMHACQCAVPLHGKEEKSQILWLVYKAYSFLKMVEGWNTE